MHTLATVRRCAGFARSVTTAALVLASLAVGAAASAATATIYVSTSAKSTNAGTSCLTARFSSIDAAIAAAAPGSTVFVCTGTYPGQVVVSKPVVLVGDHATILAFGRDTGVTVPVSGATVEGFTVKGALGEGILVVGKPYAPVRGVTIEADVVQGNDLGNPTGAPIGEAPYAECKATPQPAPAPAIPGDCGEGIHLMVVAHSTVADNYVVDNAGGILLTDELGPTDHNTIEDNTVLGNGTTGQGSGVLLASPLPGGAVYDNVVEGNTVSDDAYGIWHTGPVTITGAGSNSFSHVVKSVFAG